MIATKTKPKQDAINLRLLTGSQLLLLSIIENNAMGSATQIFIVVEQLSEICNGGVEIISLSGINRSLAKLEELSLLQSWEEFSDNSRGVPRRMYGLTWDGARVLEHQRLLLLMAQSVCLPD